MKGMKLCLNFMDVEFGDVIIIRCRFIHMLVNQFFCLELAIGYIEGGLDPEVSGSQESLPISVYHTRGWSMIAICCTFQRNTDTILGDF